MNNYSIRIEVEDGKVEEILDRLSKAQKEIYKCYTELENLGVLTLRETATPKWRPEPQSALSAMTSASSAILAINFLISPTVAGADESPLDGAASNVNF